MKNRPDHESEARSGLGTLTEVAREHPFLTGALVVLMVLGGILAWMFGPEDISGLRRIAGGALLGGLSWLVVMMGRMLD